MGVRPGGRPQDVKVGGADGSRTRKKKWRHLLETHPYAGASGGKSCRELPHPTALRQPPLRRTVPAMVGALPRRPSADHSRAGTSTASILAGLRCRAGAPVHAHEVPIAAVVVPAPFSLSSFSRSLSCSSSLSLSRALARVSSLPLPLLSLPLASVLYSRSFSLSPFSYARRPLARVLPLSLSLFAHARLPSRVFSRALSLSLSLPLVLVATQGPPTSPAVPCPARRTQCHRSAPSAGRPSASHRVRRATSRRFPAPRGITPPRWEQIGSTPATIYPRVLGQRPSCAGLGVRRCNRTREGSRVATARENARRRAEKGVSGRASKEGRRAVGPSEGAGLRKAMMRSERCAAGSGLHLVAACDAHNRQLVSRRRILKYSMYTMIQALKVRANRRARGCAGHWSGTPGVSDFAKYRAPRTH